MRFTAICLSLVCIICSFAEGKSFRGYDSSTAYPGYKIVEQPVTREGPQYQIDQGSADVLLIQTSPPWDSNANTEALESLGYSYIVTDFDGLQYYNINSFQVVLIVNDQVQAFYDDYAQNYSTFESYVFNGGTLVFFACDLGWADGNNYTDLPGNVQVGDDYSNYNYISNSSHPIVTGELRTGSSRTALEDSDLFNNYCSHNYFITSSLPVDSDIILRSSNNNEPTLVRYDLGLGTVIASGLTWEYGYDRYDGDYKQSGYGRALPDVFLYAFTISGDLQTADVLSVYVDDNRAAGRRPRTLKMPGDILDVVAKVDFEATDTIEFDGTYELSLSIAPDLLDPSSPVYVYRRADPAGIATGTELQILAFNESIIDGQKVITIPEISTTGESMEYVFRTKLSAAQVSRVIDATIKLSGNDFEYEESLSQNGSIASSGFRKIILTNREALYKKYVAPGGNLNENQMFAIDNLWRNLYRIAEQQNASLIFADKWDHCYDGENDNPIISWITDRESLSYDANDQTASEETDINEACEHVAKFLDEVIQNSGGADKGRYVLIFGGDVIIPMYRAYDGFGAKIVLGTKKYFPGNASFYASQVFRTDSENGYIHTDGRYHDIGDPSNWKDGDADEVYLGRITGGNLLALNHFFVSSSETPVSTHNVVMLENYARDEELADYQDQSTEANFTIIDSLDGTNLDTEPVPQLSWWQSLLGIPQPVQIDDESAGTPNLFSNLFTGNLNSPVNSFSIWRSMTHGSVEGLQSSEGASYFTASNLQSHQINISKHFSGFEPLFIFDACLVGQVDGNDQNDLINFLTGHGIGAAVAPSVVTFSKIPASRTNFDDILSEKLFLGSPVGKAKQDAFDSFLIPSTQLDNFTRLAVNVFGVPWRKVAPPLENQPASMASRQDEDRISIKRVIPIRTKGMATFDVEDSLTYSIGFGPLQVTKENDAGSGFDFLSIDGYDMDLSGPETPVLPYALKKIVLPRDSEIVNVSLNAFETSTTESIHLPGFRRNIELPGNTLGEFVELQDPSGIYPRVDADYAVASTNDNVVVSVVFYPLQYNADSNQLIQRTSGEIIVEYRSELQGITRVVENDAPVYGFGEPVKVTALVENTSPGTVEFRHVVEILDDAGDVAVGEAQASAGIASASQEDIWVTTFAPNSGGNFKLMSRVYDGNNALITETQLDIYVRSGAVTGFLAQDRFLIEESGFFHIDFNNYSDASIELFANIEILDDSGIKVQKLLEQTATANPSNSMGWDIPWIPTDGLNPGTYHARLVVTDSNGENYYADSETFIVGGSLFASAGEDMEVSEGDTVSLDGSGSYNLDGEFSYSWSLTDYEGGIEVALSNPESASPSFTVPVLDGHAVQRYHFQLTVSDNENNQVTDTVTVNAYAVNHAPVFEGNFSRVVVNVSDDLSWDLEPGLFSDLDSDSITLTAEQSSGAPLPEWLSFNSELNQFTGKPGPTDMGETRIVLRANDGIGGETRVVFSLIVQESGGLWSGADRFDNGWSYLPWFGYFAELQNSWIYHLEHGYQYCIGINTGSISIFDLGLGSWLWTSADLYPYIYKFGANPGWYWYFTGGTFGSRWFARLPGNIYVPEADMNTTGPNTAPTVPGLLIASNVSATGATVSWVRSTDPDGDNVQYEVQIKRNGIANWDTAGTTSETNYVWQSLNPGESYDVRVRATDGVSASDWREKAMAFTTEQSSNTAPTTPGAIAVASISSSGGIISWGLSSDVDGDSISYTLQYKKSSSAVWIDGGQTNQTQKSLSDLEPDTAYDVRVRASDGIAASSWREQLQAFRTEPDGVVNPTPEGFAYIPPGQFEMGDALGEGASDETPVHTVHVSAFNMSEMEVTNAEVAEVFNWAVDQVLMTGNTDRMYNINSTESLLNLWDDDCQMSWDGNHLVVDPGKGDYPCVEITWYGALAYCYYLTLMEGDREQAIDVENWTMDITANGYRLPTEAEWEKAARGRRNGNRYPWGDEINHDTANYHATGAFAYDTNISTGYHPDWIDGSGNVNTNQVDAFAVNDYGLKNMTGNVGEWCYDWYSGSSYSSSGFVDPINVLVGDRHVIRGGGWADDAFACRISHRSDKTVENSSESTGFRIACSIPAGSEDLVDAGYVDIPAGSFEMGDSSSGNYFNTGEYFVHEVTLSDYKIQETEVTNAQLAEVMNWAIGQGLADYNSFLFIIRNNEGSKKTLMELKNQEQIVWRGGQLVVDPGMENYPCTAITWYGALAYCHFLTIKEGGLNQAVDFSDWSVDTSASGYRLPTEAEWEKAARSDLYRQRFPWGDEIRHELANYYTGGGESYDLSGGGGLSYHPDWYIGSLPVKSPVKSFAASSNGLYDMSGNVAEWCLDNYSSSYYQSSPSSNPTGPASGSSKIIRGGSWGGFASDVTVYVRSHEGPTQLSGNIGFRVVKR